MTVTLSSLQDLAALLNGDRQAVKLGALRAIHEQIAQAGNGNKNLHPALIDLLFERYEKTVDREERSWCVFILLQTGDPRKYIVAEQQFLVHDDNAILIMCADTMAALPAQRRARILGPVVMARGRATRQRLAANLLSDCLVWLEADVALRVAILSDHHPKLEEITADTVDLWIRELAGPYRLNVRRILSSQGDASLTMLLENWSRLPVIDACWAMNQGVARKLPGIKDVLLEILSSEQQAALLKHALISLDAAMITAADEKILERLYFHPDDDVQAAALAIGSSELSWESYLQPQMPDTVRLGVLQRIARHPSRSALPFLRPLLEDENWKIRARATEALVLYGSAALGILKDHLLGDHQEARISAARALQQLGQEQWLAEAMA